MISITRYQDIGKLDKTGDYLFAYGRRKTGKTYLIKNYSDWDKYYFVGRDNTIYEENQILSYETFQREIFQLLKDGRKVVVDEFQRLLFDFMERLQSLGQVGKLVVISSTLWLTKELLNKKSPILGMFSEFRINLIDERDILLNLKNI